MDYTRVTPRPVYRRSTAVSQVPVPQEELRQERPWGTTVWGRPIQLILTVQIANENGGVDTYQGFSKTDRTSPGDTRADREMQCKVSILKKLNIDRNMNSRDNSLLGEIEEYIRQNPDAYEQRKYV